MRLRTKFSFAALLLLISAAAVAQTPLIMPMPEQQFFTPTGTVCSGCFVYTYISGTFTPLASYTDYTGLTANTNPIVLNSAGFAATSIGAQVGIWLSPTSTYRIVVQNAAHSALYTVDGITGQLPGTTSNPLTILDSGCNQLTIGLSNFQTGLCFPAPPTNITLTFPAAANDTLVARATTDTLSNKTLSAPNFNNICSVTGGPGTYACIGNQNPTGTTLNSLVKLVNAPSQAQIAATTDTTGIMGICVSGCANSGTATIQEDGQVSCNFDGATTAGDYVTISSTTAGDCHDVGAGAPTSTQNLGRVLSTNASSGLYAMVLFAPSSGAGPTVLRDVTQHTHTGDITTDTISTLTYAAASTTTQVTRIYVAFQSTVQGAGSSQIALTQNGTLLGSANFSATGRYVFTMEISNTNSTSAQQISYNLFGPSSMQTNGASGIVNTSSSSAIALQFGNANNSDTQQINQFVMEVF